MTDRPYNGTGKTSSEEQSPMLHIPGQVMPLQDTEETASVFAEAELIASDMDTSVSPQSRFHPASFDPEDDGSTDTRAIIIGAPSGNEEPLVINFDYKHMVGGFDLHSSGGQLSVNMRLGGYAELRYSGQVVSDRISLGSEALPYYSGSATNQTEFESSLRTFLNNDGYLGGSSSPLTDTYEKDLTATLEAAAISNFDPANLELWIIDTPVDHTSAEETLVCSFDYGEGSDPYADEQPIQATPNPGIKNTVNNHPSWDYANNASYITCAILSKTHNASARFLNFGVGPNDDVTGRSKLVTWGSGSKGFDAISRSYKWQENFFGPNNIAMSVDDTAFNTKPPADGIDYVLKHYAAVDACVSRHYLYVLMENGTVYKSPSPSSSDHLSAFERVTHVPKCRKLKGQDNGLVLFLGERGAICVLDDSSETHGRPETVVPQSGSAVVDAVAHRNHAGDGYAVFFVGENGVVMTNYVDVFGFSNSNNYPQSDSIRPAGGWTGFCVRLEGNFFHNDIKDRNKPEGGVLTISLRNDGTLQARGDYFYGLNGEGNFSDAVLTEEMLGSSVSDFAVCSEGLFIVTEDGLLISSNVHAEAYHALRDRFPQRESLEVEVVAGAIYPSLLDDNQLIAFRGVTACHMEGVPTNTPNLVMYVIVESPIDESDVAFELTPDIFINEGVSYSAYKAIPITGSSGIPGNESPSRGGEDSSQSTHVQEVYVYTIPVQAD